MWRRRRKPETFDVPVHDMVLRITAPPRYEEEARVAAMSATEQLQAYAVRNPAFRTSKRPIVVAEDAPPLMRRMAELSAYVGVGPMFTFQGAITEYVGLRLARNLDEVYVGNGGDHFIVTSKQRKVEIHRQGEASLSLVVKSDFGPVGVYTTVGRLRIPADSVDSVAVVADSCILADAAATATMAILSRPNSWPATLRFLRGLRGVHGGVVAKGEQIGIAGELEITP